MSIPKIQIKNLSVEFSSRDNQNRKVIKDLSLNISEGEFVTVIGSSGCGKSTLLNVIAGISTHQRLKGTINIHWENTQDKNIGYVFQKDVLLPWKTIRENVEVGLQIKGRQPQQRKKVAEEWLEKVGLKGYENAYPYQLSGGMRQRINIIRTLAYDPEVVLMDEPFGALDAQTRIILQKQLLELWEETRKTIVFVTHDLEESVLLAERVVLLGSNPGRVKRDYTVNFPYPRDLTSLRFNSNFQKLTQEIWRDLSMEIQKE